jgi:hypothetical protein
MNNKKIRERLFVVNGENEYYNTLQCYQIVADVVVKKFDHAVMQLRNILCSCVVVEFVVVVAVVLK